ncbi:glycosyltransferase family protein [Roseimaritima ulvae]|uniref:glycosyltransferase family 39 protein n=1 Tax=Roseimaritima ulvae TaxID=980254 RepID=UPI0013903DE2|nr:glycosyltransferase family 39 protein [Roseimaritima ulvae]
MIRPSWPWLLLLGSAVAVLSAIIRIAECGESLWVDELHSAWAIAGRWDQVAARAAAGNQTPWYFWLLRVWTNTLGSSELMLRMPSVLALAATSGVLVVAAARASGRWMIGVLAGGLLAIDLNAIYFGSEARSYGLVILSATIAVWAAVELADPHSAGRNRWRWTLWLACLFGLLMHPTAGLVLAVVVAAGWIWSRLADAATAWKAIVLVGSAAAAVGAFAVNAFVVSRVWQQRDHWNTFGVPQSAWDLWTMWPWTIVAIPIGVWAIAVLAARCFGEQPQNRQRLQVWPFLLSVVLAGTLACWLLASYAGVPMWHRRYIVGLMPLVAWATADAWAAAIDRLPRRLRFRGAGVVWGALAMVVALMGLLYDQQTATLWRDNRVTLRAEDWRGAAAWLNQRRAPGEPVYVGAELIESNQLAELDPADPQYESIRQYLLFPVSGPYAIEGAEPLGLAAQSMRHDLRKMLTDAPENHSPEDRSPDVRWMIYRIAEPQLNQLYLHANQPTLAAPAIRFTEGMTQGFGALTVVRLETRRD